VFFKAQQVAYCLFRMSNKLCFIAQAQPTQSASGGFYFYFFYLWLAIIFLGFILYFLILFTKKFTKEYTDAG